MKILDSELFWIRLEELVKSGNIVIDRPCGSYHPVHTDMYYAHDYGYIENTSSQDGECVDVWLGNGDRDVITGVICTVDLEKKDTELKVLLGCTPEDEEDIMHFYNCDKEIAAIILRRPE